MTKRLQVLLADRDYRDIQRLAKAKNLSIAEWVRQALDAARRIQPIGDAARKLDAIRAAARHDYPTADVEQMNAEIARGYTRQP
ncbi:MAG TPA: hypothetical protein VFG38_15270 [Pseudomonadales bacterium]|nr:hypothetical protein [Pseudomonadales bacterium]